MSTNSNSTHLFTCVTCNVAFREAEKQRLHYKTDWHRYNLKRKIAELPPVTAQVFAERVQLQKSEIEKQKSEVNVERFCTICSKHFTTLNSYTNHLQSNRHRDLETKAQLTDAQREVMQTGLVPKPVKMETTAPETVQEDSVQMQGEQESNWEDVDEEEEFDETKAIPLTTCLFCELECNSVEQKCEHMAKEHSFYIPDIDHVSDLDSLLKFLGMKVGAYHVCLWCSSKCYPTLKAVQQHMFDKGHSKMRFESDTLYEYADFYEYEDDEYEADEDENMSGDEAVESVTNFIEDDNYELVLPSGARIGHRSLFRYYKQTFGHRSLALKQQTNQLLSDKYKAICGYAPGPTRQEIQTKRKDLSRLQRWKSKMYANIGVASNKLQKHYRRQNVLF